MSTKRITVLEYALLGLLARKPYSGYELMKFFRDTPMARFSDSPGAIYPALRRLTAAGLLRQEATSGKGVRDRREHTLTDAGRSALKDWLLRLPTKEEVVRRLNESLLRFAFMDDHLDEADIRRFLQTYRDLLLGYLKELKEYRRSSAEKLSVHGLLALDNGIAGFDCQIRWAERALAQFGDEKSAS